jgi:hypothetical protein
LLEATDKLLDKGALVILLVQARHHVEPGLLAKAGAGSITKDGVRLDPHQALAKAAWENHANDSQVV